MTTSASEVTAQQQINESNGMRVSSLLADEAMLGHLYAKMKAENLLDSYPILKVCCQT
jgi:hypothetical protein